MIDIDYAPAVFAGIIFFVLLLPALFGIFFVDSYRNWENDDTSANDENPFK